MEDIEESCVVTGNSDVSIIIPTSKSNEIFNRSMKSSSSSKKILHQIPEDILNDECLNQAIAQLLPPNYHFEIHKTLWRLRKEKVTRVALQFPEGLLMYACTLADIFERFAQVEVWILGEVTYGACCVDDFTAKALGCDFLVHYGHSCLVSVETTLLRSMYVFVEIDIDIEHLANTLRSNFEDIPSSLKSNSLSSLSSSLSSSISSDDHLSPSFHTKSPNPMDRPCRLFLMSTIQFVSALQKTRDYLNCESSRLEIVIPQSKPLSPGELLGCTAPSLSTFLMDGQCQKLNYLIYVGDGRFHLEALMIANPNLIAYCYNPYNKILSREHYDHHEMQRMRREAIQRAALASTFGLILGTLGRQGSLHVLKELETRLKKCSKLYYVVLLSEISPKKLDLFLYDNGNGNENNNEDDQPHSHCHQPDAWIQTACPRLSIDWGESFSKPLLTPYELQVALSLLDWQNPYPMDYYASQSLGPWTPRHSSTHR
jgi:2-(3-amino-3-carboxypropyl)histidine synthase